MKIGDEFEVTIGGKVVGRAKAVALDEKESQVELVIPATRVVMSYTTQVTLDPARRAGGTEHQVLGVEPSAGVEVETQPVVDAPNPQSVPQTNTVEEVKTPEVSTPEVSEASNEGNKDTQSSTE